MHRSFSSGPRAILVLFVLVAVPPARTVEAAAEGDWPAWRYDAGRTAASPLELPAELHLQWERHLPAPRPAYPNDPRLCFDRSYEPIVAGKRLVVPSMVTDSVTAFDTDTGEPAWTFFADGPVRFAPLAHDGRVYFVSDDGCLYCLSADQGRLLWKFCGLPADRAAYKLLGNERLISRWPVRGGPVLADGIIYFTAGIWPNEGVFVYAVDAATGRAVWTNNQAGFIPDGALDHGTRRDGGLSPQGYLAVVGQKLIVPNGRALPAFFDRKSGRMEPYTSGWGGRVGLAKGCWYVCGTAGYLFQSGDVYAMDPPPTTGPTPKPDELVRLSDFAAQMNISLDTASRWVKDFGLAAEDRGGQRFLRLQRPDPITYLSWWTSSKSQPVRPGEQHALDTRPRLQVDAANMKELGVFREPVLTGNSIYYSLPKPIAEKQFKDEDRQPPKTANYAKIVACDLTHPANWTRVYQGGWGTPHRLVQWPAARFDETWSLPSNLKVHIKAGPRLYAGSPGVVAAVDIPAPGRQPRVAWQARIEGTPTRMLAADGKLLVVTAEGPLFCFGGTQVKPKIYAASHAGPAARPDRWTALAQKIFAQTGVREGYCLALGLGTGRLVEEIARQSKLHVIVIEPDAGRVDAARRAFDALGLYGSRVHVLAGDLATLRLPPFMASLAVSEDLGPSGLDGKAWNLQRLFASLRPYGGVACLPIAAGRCEAISRQVEKARLPGAQVDRVEGLTLLTRAGALTDSADWTHEGGDAAHTFASKDRRARPPFGVLWFGGGLDRVIPCLKGPIPRVAGGRMFLYVGSDLHAADIYTGRHLWTQSVGRLGEFVATDGDLYVISAGDCLRLDPATGKPVAMIAAAKQVAGQKRLSWQHLCIAGEDLVGTAGKYLVCVDRRHGELRWQFKSRQDGFGLALGAGKVFCVDHWLPVHRRRGEPPTEEAAIRALDLATGKVLWQATAGTPADNTPPQTDGMSNSLDPQLAYCDANDVLVFSRNRSTAAAYQGATGKLLWSRDLPCKDPPRAFTRAEPPIVLADLLITHPGEAIDLLTGTARPRMWKGINQELRGCGRALGSPCIITVRDGHLSYYDLATGRHAYVRGIRSGCTNSLLAAGGILNAANYGRHCTCNWPISTSLALATMPEAAAWDPAGATLANVNSGEQP